MPFGNLGVLVPAFAPIYNRLPLMLSRAAVLIPALGLLMLIAPTPFPVQFAGQLQAARTALRAGRPDLALPPLEQALAREPALAGISLDMIEVALGAERPDLAIGLIEALPASTRQSDQVACYQARAAIQSDDWRAAIDQIEAAGRQCRQPLEQLNQLAAELTRDGDYEGARTLLDELIRVNPGSPLQHYRLGLLEATRRPELALSHLAVANELDPELPVPSDLVRAIQTGLDSGEPAYALAQAGQSLARAGEWAMAAEALGNALAIDPDYTEARAYLGLALDRSGGDGLEQLELAVSEAPEAALPHQLLGRHWRLHGEPALALAEFEMAASLAPEDPLIAVDLGAGYAAVGDLPAARAAYLHATELSPNDPVVWLLLAQFSVDFEVELVQLGIPAARRAIALQPDSAEAVDLLGYAYYLAGRWELASRFLGRALELDPQVATAHYHMGLLQLSRGQVSAGKRALQQAWNLDPEGRIGNLALRSLENLP